jgi:hypothetical protein
VESAISRQLLAERDKLMESNYQQLSQGLAEIIETLRATQPGDISPPNKDVPEPHMEIIDFDKLSALLQDTIVNLNHACDQEREREVLRDWFVRRINSFRKARQAIVPGEIPPNTGKPLNEATLPELIRLFEEASTRLRGTAGNLCRRETRGPLGTADEVRQFKS